MTVDELLTILFKRKAPREELTDLLARALPSLNIDERSELQDRLLLRHHELAKQLKTYCGYSVPGNDPQKPN